MPKLLAPSPAPTSAITAALTKTLDARAGIYAVRNRSNGKVFVVAHTYDQRDHWLDFQTLLDAGGCVQHKHIQAAWKKYGRNYFDCWPLIDCPMVQLEQKRVEFIRAFESDDPKRGYN